LVDVMGNRAFWLGRTNRKAFKFGGTCAGPGFARGEGEGTEDWDGAVLGWPKERERCDVSLVDCRQVLLCCVHQQVRGRFAVHRRPEWTPAFVTHVQGLGVAHLYRDINTTKIIARTKAGDHIIARIRKFV
jgi:hypothetical protein